VASVSTATQARRTQAKGVETRAAILERAVDLASAQGLEGLSLGHLAADLKMSKSGLFAHFGSKQELQLATVAAAAERFFAAVIEPAAAAPDGAPRLRAMADNYLAHLAGDDYAGGCFWGATSAEYDDRPGPVRDAIAAALDGWLAELERQAAAAGLERPDRVAFELYAVVMGANSRFRLTGDRGVFALARETVEGLLAQVPQHSRSRLPAAPRPGPASSAARSASGGADQSSRPTWRRIETESE
jgi:AcrR family transcriptional regulator